jgi:hypothetical protein
VASAPLFEAMALVPVRGASGSIRGARAVEGVHRTAGMPSVLA